jgi:tetratricopeptide (TPR) repeat protein
VWGDPGTRRSDTPGEPKDRDGAIKYHLKNLSEADPESRRTSAAVLGLMGATEAVPNLIELLKDESIKTRRVAGASLNKITGKNFGYNDPAEWSGWWENNKDKFLSGPSGSTELSKVRAQASNRLGLMYMSAGSMAQAHAAFLDAVDKDPEIADYRNNLGLASFHMGNYLEAMDHFEQTICLDDALPQPVMNVGQCFAALNKHIEAMHWYRKAMEKDKKGELWEPCWKLGKQLQQKGDFSMSLEYLLLARQKAEKKGKNQPEIHRDLAIAYYGLDQHASAWREIRNLHLLGFELHKDFETKVRQALQEQGIDPDQFDKPVERPGADDGTSKAPGR